VERSLKRQFFALGIMPYISASIVVQLMGIAIPYCKSFKMMVKVVEKD
jgi:preprotein translocase subunit SecY